MTAETARPPLAVRVDPQTADAAAEWITRHLLATRDDDPAADQRPAAVTLIDLIAIARPER